MRGLRWILLSLPLLFGAVFFLLPLAAIMQRALVGTADALPALAATLRSSATWSVVGFSAWQALLSTALTLAAALPAAYLLARYRVPGAGGLRALAAVPFVLPTIVVALAFRTLLGQQGFVNRALVALLGLDAAPLRLDETLPLVLLAHLFYNYSVVLRIVGGYWSSADPRLEEAAQAMGASRWRILREITLPLAAPAVLAAALLVFTFTFAAFGTVLILGGPRMRTVEVAIYDLAINQFNLPAAAVLSLLQMATTLALTVIYTRLQRRAAVPQTTHPRPLLPLRSWRLRLAALVVLGGLVVLVLAPLGALVAGAMRTGDGWSLRNFALLQVNQRGAFAFVPPERAMLNSLRFASLATLLALLLGVPAAYLLARPRSRLSRWLDPLFMLPLGTSAVTLGFGYIIAFRSYGLPWGGSTPDLRRSAVLLPLAHTLLALPFVIRTMLPALRRLNPQLRAAAAVLGAGPRRVWWEVDLPLLLPALVVAALFAFTISLGDFGAALILSVTGPDNATMPVVIYRFLGQPGATNYGQALAMSTLLMLVTLISFGLIERLRSPQAEL